MIALCAAAALIWLAVLLLAPQLPVSVSAAVYLLGSFICHQRPERSFHLAGVQLPVCARCLGIYVGVTIGALAALRPYRFGSPRLVMLMAVVPALASLAIEGTGLSPLSNAVRAATGVIAGSLIAAVVLATLHYEQCAPRRPIAPHPRRTSI
jgi:uncharacterized membrane protein